MDFELTPMSEKELAMVEGFPSKEMQAEVEAAITKALDIFQKHFNRSFIRPTVEYDLQGHTAGIANSKRIRLNIEVLYDHREDMLTQTIPHEVAHVVQRQLYPKSKSHGLEWRSLMHILGIPANRTHSYETTPARVRKREYTYICDCQVHMVTKTLHNRMQNGQTYTCRHCKGQLREMG
jgi:SprT protein